MEVTLYIRNDCHLCEIARAYLEELQVVVPHQLKVIDVDSDTKLRTLYGFNVPVILIGPYKLSAPIEKKDIEISLLAVQHSIAQEEKIAMAVKNSDQQIPISWTKADNFTRWLSKHYLSIFNILVFIYLGLPFLAPVLMKTGAEGSAKIIYRLYGYVCHQFAYRSWFLFGEQEVYPRAEAYLPNLITYQQATGYDGNDLFAARDFIGNDHLGYKVALCERDTAIYAGILLFGLIFSVTRKKLKSLHWIIWLIIGITPIALDGLSQLISQMPFHLLQYRESTPQLRVLTGFLFGFVTAWFGYPYVEESMTENIKYLEHKFNQASKWARFNRS
jgi:uncharacterized membrane protein